MTRSVVLVHGIFDTGAVFGRMERFLRDRQFETHAPTLLRRGRECSLEDLAARLMEYVEEHLRGRSFHLIGFSMGGLVGRYYVQRLSGIERIRRLITISAPHRGSRMAHLLDTMVSRQMRPGSDFLRELNSDPSVLERARVVSIWTPWDLMVVPARSSRLPVGTELRLSVKLHPWMLRDRRCMEAVARFLD